MLARPECKQGRARADSAIVNDTAHRPCITCAAAVLACLVVASVPTAMAAATCSAASGPHVMPLVELFTSEGCDSCPPADRWLSAQFPAARPEPPALALSYHVDYWDRLGWRDRFASAQFTQRQYDEMRANGATFVYTPQVLVQGHDAPGWKQGRVAPTLDAARRDPARATIGLDMAVTPDALAVRARVLVGDAALRKRAALWLAYADSGHATDVAAGENRGVRLTHDHVVRSLQGPFALDANGAAARDVVMPTPRDPGRLPVVVAFVQDGNNGDILQSLALAACHAP
jgi:hypothetical protein